MLLRYLKKFESHRELLEKEFLALIRKKIDQKEDFTKKYNTEFEEEQLKEIKSLMEEVMKTDPKLIKKVKKEMKQ
jgi:hypothetical protein